MARSPELRDELGGSLDAGEIHDRAKKEIKDAKDSRWASKGRAEQLERQYAAEQEAIAKLEASIVELRERAAAMDDAEFERRFVDLNDGIKATKERVFRYSHEQEAERKWTSFVDMREVTGFKEFLEKWPMYWMPRKEEVARVLSIAKQMHDARGAGEDEPLRILEIGGANAAFADLLADLAEENGIDVRYDVVDPEKETVTDAAMAHVGDKRFSFHAETAGKFAMKANEGDERLTLLLAERERLKKEGEVKLRDLKALAEVIRKRVEESPFGEDEMLRTMGILEQDFGITMPHAAMVDGKAFAEAFDDGKDTKTYEDVPGIVSGYFARLQGDVEKVTREIEAALMERPPAYDLVINAWMPPSMDFTKDIRAANGAAVLYAIQTWGSTGIQERSGSMGRCERLGEEDSYGGGRMYRMESAWVGHSLPEFRLQERAERAEGAEGVPVFLSIEDEFCNAFLIQRRVDIGRGKGMLDPDPARAGIKVGKPYPWEDELTKKQGGISPVVPIGGVRRRGGDYHDDLNALVRQMREAREGK